MLAAELSAILRNIRTVFNLNPHFFASFATDFSPSNLELYNLFSSSSLRSYLHDRQLNMTENELVEKEVDLPDLRKSATGVPPRSSALGQS